MSETKPSETPGPDCGDGSCMFAENLGGMRTNGGCRCLEALPHRQAREVRFAFLRLRQRVAELEREEDQLAEIAERCRKTPGPCFCRMHITPVDGETLPAPVGTVAVLQARIAKADKLAEADVARLRGAVEAEREAIAVQVMAEWEKRPLREMHLGVIFANLAQAIRARSGR